MNDMSTDSQLQEFQKEFRESVTRKLDYLTEKVDNLPLIFANQVEFNKVKEEVEVLKEFRNRAIGIIMLFNVIIAIAGYLISHH